MTEMWKPRNFITERTLVLLLILLMIGCESSSNDELEVVAIRGEESDSLQSAHPKAQLLQQTEPVRELHL